MKLKKNKIIIASILLSTLFFNNNYIISNDIISQNLKTNIVYASNENISTNESNQSNEDINDVSSNENAYKLINDSSNTINDADINVISENLNKIFENSKNDDNNHQLRIYTFIYDDSNKSVVSAEKEIINKYKLSNAINPIIFIYNKSNNDYRFIIDERINGYVSKGYYQYMTNNVLLKNKTLTKESLNEFLIRISSITGLAIKDNMSGVSTSKTDKEKINESNFDVISFNNNNNTSINNNKTEKSNSDESKNNNSNKDNNIIYAFAPLLLAFLTIGVILLKRKNKLNSKKG